MKIGDAAVRTGLSSKTIRYYESIGLLQPAKREDNGYRDYSDTDLDQLNFLQRARTTGFSLEECRQLLALYQDDNRHSSHVKALVEEKIRHLDTQLKELQAMRDTLVTLAGRCAGDEGSHCAIIDELSHEPEKNGQAQPGTLGTKAKE